MSTPTEAFAPPAPTMPPKVAVGLVKAQRAAKAVPKLGENKHANYRYATSESIIDEGRLAMNEGDLALLQTNVELQLLDRGEQEDRNDGDEQREKSRLRAYVRVHYLLAHISGESFGFVREWPCIVQKGRPLDKAEGGALTTCLAYTMRDLLSLPRDNDLAAMDRRDDTDQRSLAPSSSSPAPANETKPASAPEQPASSPAPAATEHPFKRLLPLIQAKQTPLVQLLNEVDKAEVDEEERNALRLIVTAYQATEQQQIADIGAKLRQQIAGSEKSERLKQWALGAIKPAWEALSAPVAAA